eukprot:TRINITY_DN1927_c0_g1_i1.p1 TRINITY_DN1927_c0_g1~~TRINITY_DN1927_c0_g1_i1.p1  ORF type:complete len:329 (+),score=107.42 TRINITY_DN1927_c0_g1_i1:110-988(+)
MAARCKAQLDVAVKEALTGKVSAAPGQKHAEPFGCSICVTTAFSTAVKTVPCGHMFHKPCLKDWLFGKAGDAHNCPDCRTALPAGHKAFQPASRQEQFVLECLDLECPQGCGDPCGGARKRMRFSELESHVLNDCPKTAMLCSGLWCDVVKPRPLMQLHLDECPRVLVTCDQCKKLVQRRYLLVHQKGADLRVGQCVVPCEFCNKLVPFHEMEKHLAESCTGTVPVTAFVALREKNKQVEKEKKIIEKEKEKLVTALADATSRENAQSLRAKTAEDRLADLQGRGFFGRVFG